MPLNTVTYITCVPIFRLGIGFSFFGSDRQISGNVFVVMFFISLPNAMTMN